MFCKKENAGYNCKHKLGECGVDDGYYEDKNKNMITAFALIGFATSVFVVVSIVIYFVSR
jgi:hypothetical protein